MTHATTMPAIFLRRSIGELAVGESAWIRESAIVVDTKSRAYLLKYYMTQDYRHGQSTIFVERNEGYEITIDIKHGNVWDRNDNMHYNHDSDLIPISRIKTADILTEVALGRMVSTGAQKHADAERRN